MRKITIALAGNPNCGKTTLFNALTGAKQRVGNWPGVTVERIEGTFQHEDTEISVVDLPGIYSFSAFSLDERISREYILKDKPDLVVNIIDATNLERNLYLTTQLLEMRVPVVVALNMMDLAKRRKIHIEVGHLQNHLGCPVIPIVASKNQGINPLRREIVTMADRGSVSGTKVLYDEEVEEAIELIMEKGSALTSKHKVNPRWLSVKLLEQDELAVSMSTDDLDKIVKQETKRVEKHVGDDMDIIIADGRYGFIHGLVRDVMHRDDQLRKTVSDRIDKVVLNRLAGIPIFLVAMFLMFALTFNVGGPFIEFFDGLFGTVFVDGLRVLLERIHLPGFLVTLFADGIGGGIQTMATFVPPIFLIFLCLSLLEDSGYMARAAFVMDRLLRTIGLPGKAFVPMLTGLGCNVPAIMATRTLENERDRIMTILINPFMSCGARLPVYALFAAAFFPSNGGALIFSMYITGIVLAILTGLLLKRTILHGEVSTFVMELPTYHVPTFRGIMHHTWNRLKTFMIRAGKVIMVVVVVLNILNSLGTDGSWNNQNSEDSVLSHASKTISPVFRPMGIRKENWPAAVGLFTGIFAKEAVVGTLDSLYAQMDKHEVTSEGKEPFDFWGGIKDACLAIPAGFEGFWESLRDPLGVRSATDEVESVHPGMVKYFGGKAAAIAYLLFILIYAPCVAAIAAIYRETNIKWTLFSVGYLTGLAWTVATAFYQLATFFDHPGSSASWLVVIAAILVTTYAGLKWKSRRKLVSS
ncbi:Fe(2+) transporter permease subunit FeoB [Verrucomicrobiota bacterium]